MKSNWLAVSAVLQAQFLVADAEAFGLTDPRLCYLLDGLLLIYAIIVTALFFRERLTKTVSANDANEDTYSKVNSNTRDIYNMPHPESGGRRGNHKAQDNSLYQGLQRENMSDPYNEIGKKQQAPRKKGKGKETLYQGLSAAQRDTYDALQMMPLK